MQFRKSLQLVPLGSVVSINPRSIGKDYPYSEIEYVDISSVGSGSLTETTVYNLADAPSRAKRLIADGDSILSTVRPNRRSFLFVKNPNPRMVVSTGFAVLRPSNKIDPWFLYYTVTNQRFTDYLTINAKGAAYPAVDTDTIARAEIFLPPLPIQRKIASILSAYDDLIENNMRRIKILEEIAQAIYREWFVHFRFPGHEKVKMVNSPLGKIPEGWEVTSLGDILAELLSGSRPKGGINPTEGDVPSIGAENITGLGEYDYSKDKFVSHTFFAAMRKGHVKHGDVLLYKDGAHIGKKSMFRNGFPHKVCCVNEHVFILRCNQRCSQNYLYFWLDQPEMTQNIRNLNANAAQPGINQAGVKELSILLPTASCLEEFDNMVNPLLDELFNLAKKNNILRRTRDLLLPKLISGEVNVGELDIKTGGS